MTKIRRGGYIFVSWKGDHAPRHVHVYRDGKLPGARSEGPDMKIRSVSANNRRRSFELRDSSRTLAFPYSKCDPIPHASDPVQEVFVDRELAREAFTYRLRSGKEGSVHVEEVLEYNQDPTYLRDALLYQLTVEARKQVDESPLAKREIIRRLGTSAAQFYRLIDQTNYRKSVDQLLKLLHVLDCEVDLVVRPKPDRKAA